MYHYSRVGTTARAPGPVAKGGLSAAGPARERRPASPPNWPDGLLRGSESAKVGDPQAKCPAPEGPRP
eukprot:14926664-Alexandrium_andersonii.AAC.1